MNKYEKEILQAQLNNEKAVLKQLEEMYKEALLEINSKIEILMARQDADLQRVIYQVQYQQALKTQIQAILENLQTKEFESISEYLAQSYQDGFIGTMYNLQGQGIPLIFPIDQEQVLAAIQTESNLSTTLYEALGHNVKDLQKKIAGEISRGIAGGQLYTEIVRNIAGYARIPKNNAMRIVRTEANRIQNRASMDACKKAESKGADVVKQWDASLDKRTRRSHRHVDGEIRELDEPFSNGLMYPSDPSGRASEVINCRCALLQRARWAVGNDFTKWGEDAPVMIDDDGTTQFHNIEAKNYDDFKKQYLQASERVRLNAQKMKGKNVLENNGESSKIVAGAVSGARNPFGNKAKEHAKKYYGLVRSMKTDVAKIAKTTGISKEKIQSVKDFIFNEKHDLGGSELEYFEPDYMMAESWQRLMEGKPEKHDITMINHEVMEKELMENGMSQEEAHIKASKKYNYSKEAGEYYAKIKKYKKE